MHCRSAWPLLPPRRCCRSIALVQHTLALSIQKIVSPILTPLPHSACPAACRGRRTMPHCSSTFHSTGRWRRLRSCGRSTRASRAALASSPFALPVSTAGIAYCCDWQLWLCQPSSHDRVPGAAWEERGRQHCMHARTHAGRLATSRNQVHPPHPAPLPANQPTTPQPTRSRQ